MSERSTVGCAEARSASVANDACRERSRTALPSSAHPTSLKGAWKIVKLSEVCQIQRGGSPRPIESFITEADNGINWIKIGDVAEGVKYITTTREKIKTEGAQRSREVGYGDFLLSNSMSFGRPYILRTSGCIHDGWLVLRYDRNQLTEDYLYHVLSSDFVYAQFVKFAVGAVVKNLNSEVVKQVSIPLPPLPEQRRIAAILDQADALRAKRREALAQLDSLTQAIFIEMFGDPVTNPKNWDRVAFGELLTRIDSGWSPICLDHPAVDNEWGVLKLGAVTRCEYKHTENKALPQGVEPDPELEVQAGDLLFTRKNTYDLVAACALVRMTPPRLLIPDLIFRLRLRPDATIDTNYLHQLLIHPTKRREIQKLASGSSGSMPNISKARLQTALIELPPLMMQTEFGKRIAAIEKQKTAFRASLAETESLFASLQHRAFRGEL